MTNDDVPDELAWAEQLADDGTKGYAKALLTHLASQIDRAQEAENPVELLAIAAAMQQQVGWLMRFAMSDCRRAGQSWPTLAGATGAVHSTLLRQYETGGPLVTARPAGPRGDDAQGSLRQAAARILNAAAYPGPALEASPFGTLTDTVRTLSPAMRQADAEPLLAAVARVLAEAEPIERDAPAPSSAEESRLRSALRDLRAVYDRDKLVIEAVAATQEVVIITYGGVEAALPLSEGTKVHVLIDVAMDVHKLPKERRGEFALFTAENRPLAETALTRDEHVRAGDRLTLGPRPAR